jgi:hypothetical protein
MTAAAFLESSRGRAVRILFSTAIDTMLHGHNRAALFFRVAHRSQQEAALAFNDYNLQVKKHPTAAFAHSGSIALYISPPAVCRAPRL